jgi:hypothetical protein
LKSLWRVVKTSNSYDFYLERNKIAKSNHAEDNLHEIDMGIAMCHFELAARELGLKGSFENLLLPPVDCNKYIISWKMH